MVKYSQIMNIMLCCGRLPVGALLLDRQKEVNHKISFGMYKKWGFLNRDSWLPGE